MAIPTNLDIVAVSYNGTNIPLYGGGITPTGTKQINISSNGTTTEDVTNYADAEITVAVPASAVDSGTKSITSNGNNQDVIGYAAVNVNVPNTYFASDEGKVVSNGALVAQGSDTVTSNGTYDTTLINSLIVSVATSGAQYKTGTYTPTATTTSTNNTAITTTQTIGFTPKVFILAVNNKSNIQGMGTVMVCTAFCTVGASSDNIRYTGRYSNTSNSFGGTMYIGAWTTQQGNALYFNSNTIYFRASTNYRLIQNVEYVWYAYG
jgi:hypothetical protein